MNLLTYFEAHGSIPVTYEAIEKETYKNFLNLLFDECDVFCFATYKWDKWEPSYLLSKFSEIEKSLDKYRIYGFRDQKSIRYHFYRTEKEIKKALLRAYSFKDLYETFRIDNLCFFKDKELWFWTCDRECTIIESDERFSELKEKYQLYNI